MMLRKIADAPVPCNHPEHEPPNMVVLENGVYPACGKVTRFAVRVGYGLNREPAAWVERC
jgi:hypothetical protein